MPDMDGFEWEVGVAPPGIDGYDWIRAEGGPLPRAIYVKLAQDADGKPMVTALHIEGGERITSADLRIPLGAVADHFLAGWSPEGPNLEGVRFKYHEEEWMGWAMMREFIDESVPRATSALGRGRGAAPPTTADLKSFALTYLEEFSERPRGAVTRTAQRSGMHRVTAHKWIQRCREAGLLPDERKAE